MRRNLIKRKTQKDVLCEGGGKSWQAVDRPNAIFYFALDGNSSRRASRATSWLTDFVAAEENGERSLLKAKVCEWKIVAS